MVIIDSVGNVVAKPNVQIDTIALQSLKEHFFILRQDYSLYDKRKKKFYGYNDQGRFGTTYSIGIKCQGFNLIFDEAVFPWEYDSKYKTFKSNKLTPVVTSSKYYPLIDSLSLNYVNLDSVITPCQTIRDEFLYASYPFTSIQRGFNINDSDTCKVGTLVWIYKESGDFEQNDVKFKFVTSSISIDMVGYADLKEPIKNRECLGCVLLTTNNDGTNNYYLAGVASHANQRWVLNFPFKDFQFNKNKTQAKQVESGRLTEIKHFE